MWSLGDAPQPTSSVIDKNSYIKVTYLREAFVEPDDSGLFATVPAFHTIPPQEIQPAHLLRSNLASPSLSPSRVTVPCIPALLKFTLLPHPQSTAIVLVWQAQHTVFYGQAIWQNASITVGFCQQKGHRFERRRSETKAKEVRERSRGPYLPPLQQVRVQPQRPLLECVYLAAHGAHGARVSFTLNARTPTNYARVQPIRSPLAFLFVHYLHS
jgi:hypothetical protein